MAERPKTQTSTSTTSATPDATAPPIPSAVAVSVDVHVPAHTSRGYVVERHEHSYRVRTILVDGDTCTTVDVGKHQAYHACIRSITRAILATPRRDR